MSMGKFDDEGQNFFKRNWYWFVLVAVVIAGLIALSYNPQWLGY